MCLFVSFNVFVFGTCVYDNMCCVCVCIDKKEEEEETKKEEEVVVEEMDIEEPDEPPRPSLLDRAITGFQEGVWPKMRFLFTFKIDRDGRVGTFLRVFGCVMAFLSCFTITYQVTTLPHYIAKHTHTHTPTHPHTHTLDA